MQTKRKSMNFLKLGVLFFGVLFLWNCEKEDEQIALQDSLSEILQREFNSEEFKKTLPYKYEVDWSNPKKQFSEQLGTSFYEFPIVYTDAFNPETFNKQRKRDFYKKYKIVVAEKQDGKFDFFIARYYLKNNGENPDVENTIVGLNLNSGYNGTVHLYDKDGKMVFAKHVSRENKIEDFFLENKSDSLDDKVKPLAKWIRVCKTITTYHYIDWYWVVTGRYGRVISSTFLYTTFEGTTQREECHQEWLPDNNNDNDNGECTEDGCVDVYESTPIFCLEGYIPDENGNCVRIPRHIEEEELEGVIFTSDEINTILNSSLTSEQLLWLSRNNKAAENVLNFLNQNNSSEAKNFAKLAIEALIRNIPINLNLGLSNIISIYSQLEPKITSSNFPDYKAETLRMTAWLKERGNREFGEYIESIVPDFNSFTIGQVQEIYKLTRKQYLYLKAQYVKAIFTPVLESVTLFIQYAIIEASLGVAIPLLSKIPLSMVLRGARLNKIIRSVSELGIQSGNKSHIRLINSSSVRKAEELFATLTKNHITKINRADGVIVANMGNGNYITFRTISGVQSPGVIANIDLNFSQLFQEVVKLKFYP